MLVDYTVWSLAALATEQSMVAEDTFDLVADTATEVAEVASSVGLAVSVDTR